ncbi:lymphocyte cytosolic protein 2 [Parambassis ranga]|uniref:Lymphocyte cytosolic protein 2 n=1 Tax=Parambassis ranga TaxID=210632 RepID=A0A6P7J7U5_9TELE|nr:lymphocyte cytosolic protein 2-like [Parambassis ranga]
MSLYIIPSKTEVMGWSPESLGDYIRRLKLIGCDRVVMKGNITGAQFMNMTEFELEVFPSHYIPIITKIQSDINKGEQKKSLSRKFKSHKSPKQVFQQQDTFWGTDESELESMNDYASLGQQKKSEDYINALTEPEEAEQLHSGNAGKGNHRLPAKPPRPLRAAQTQDCQKGGQPIPLIDRNKSPEQPLPSQKGPPTLKGSAVEAPGTSAGKLPQQTPPKPPDVFNRMSKLIPAPPVAPQLTKDLDPRWYRGMVPRHQAEVALRELNKDGAFIVRDSSRGVPEHPYTLMLLNQGKVYNIKIRNQGNSYSLGNGISNTKSFPGVKEMITHHTHIPLLLIDATDQHSKERPQCCLQHPAVF